MKKLLMVLCAAVFFTGCGDNEGVQPVSTGDSAIEPEATDYSITTGAVETEIIDGNIIVEKQELIIETAPVEETSPEDIEIPIWAPEYFQYEVTDTGLDIYRRTNTAMEHGEFYQHLDIDIKTPADDISQIVIRLDYDDDEYKDMAVRTYMDETNTNFRYFRYDPDTGYFTEWAELDKLEHFVNPVMGGLSVFSKISAEDSNLDTYKWSGDVLVLIRSEKQYRDGENVYRDTLEYDDGGKETLIKREQLIYDENGVLSNVIDVTP